MAELYNQNSVFWKGAKCHCHVADFLLHKYKKLLKVSSSFKYICKYRWICHKQGKSRLFPCLNILPGHSNSDVPRSSLSSQILVCAPVQRARPELSLSYFSLYSSTASASSFSILLNKLRKVIHSLQHCCQEHTVSHGWFILLNPVTNYELYQLRIKILINKYCKLGFSKKCHVLLEIFELSKNPYAPMLC